MRLKIAVAFACMLVAATGEGRAAVVDDVTQKALTADYALRCTAAFDPSDANLDAAFAVLAPEFVGIDPTGQQVTRDEVVGELKQQTEIAACDRLR